MIDDTRTASWYAMAMLNYARQQAAEALEKARTAVLATSGPAGVQASEVPCAARDLALYLLVPQTSDHLFNLEQNPEVTVLSAGWELKGEARVLVPGEPGPVLDLFREPGAEWCVLVRVDARRLHIRGEGAWGNVETIDL